MRMTIRNGDRVSEIGVKEGLDPNLTNALLGRYLTRSLEYLFGEKCKVKIASGKEGFGRPI